MNNCRYCNRDIAPNRTYCDDKCKDKYRYYNTSYKKSCPMCGSTFVSTKGKHYCSTKCSLNAQRNNIKTCPICNIKFKARGNGIYCSDTCYRTANSRTHGYEIRRCEVCSSVFKSLKNKHEYTCSDLCKSKLFITYINRSNERVFGTSNKEEINKILTDRKVSNED